MGSLNSRRLVRVQALALAALSGGVAAGWLSSADRELTAWTALMRAPLVDGPMRVITFFGSFPWTVAALAGIGLWLWRRDGRRAALLMLGAFLTGLGIEVVLRLLVSHWRPDVATIPAAMDWRMRFKLAGFPSGHGFHSAFVFGYLAYRWHGVHHQAGRLAAFLSLLLIMCVGISRVYLGRHWPSDVFGSWLLAGVVLCWLVSARERA